MRVHASFFLVMFLIFIPSVSAQATPFPVQAGSYEGSISDTTFAVRYSFTLAAGQTATISMNRTSGDLDPFLLLFDANEALLATNDDAQNAEEQGSRNAQIVYTAGASGMYIIEATRFDQENGTGRGTFLLKLELSGTGNGTTQTDPLTVAPQFGVDFRLLEYDQFGTGRLDEVNGKRYFALGGRQGDFVRLTMTVTDGNIDPLLNILDSRLTVISRVSQESQDEISVYAALPQTAWYLIEAGRNSGTGNFILYASRLADSVIQIGQPLRGQFTRERNALSYIFNATIGDRVFASLSADNPNTRLELSIIDLNQNTLSGNTSDTNRVRVPSVIIPRTGVYILQAKNNSPTPGGFLLDLRSIPVDITKLNVQPARYNERHKGSITDSVPVVYYRFSGKSGELVTLAMNAVEPGLDPYLILADSSLNELAFNDNSGASLNARINAFALPADGDYYILATRSGLSRGTTSGDYNLELTAGQIRLLQGGLTATLRWEGTADLNLFVRAPSGQTVSWSNPVIAEGGTLQIDSNTGCITPTAQPVEHIYWSNAEVPVGDYVVWVWYQNVCGGREPVKFSLTLAFNGVDLLTITPATSPTLHPDARFETSLRAGTTGAAVLNSGTITSPSPQQRASQGGDALIVYGQSVTGTIGSDVYALFYQFQGQAGDTVVVSVERLTGDLDPVAVLRDVADRNLAMNDDADVTTSNSLLEFVLKDSGKYVIAVTRYGLRDGATTGDFRLILTRR